MTGDGTRHKSCIHAVGEQLKTCHIGASPADASKHACSGSGPKPISDDSECEMTRDRESNATQIDCPRINAIGTFVFMTSMTLVVLAQLLLMKRSTAAAPADDKE